METDLPVADREIYTPIKTFASGSNVQTHDGIEAPPGWPHKFNTHPRMFTIRKYIEEKGVWTSFRNSVLEAGQKTWDLRRWLILTIEPMEDEDARWLREEVMTAALDIWDSILDYLPHDLQLRLIETHYAKCTKALKQGETAFTHIEQSFQNSQTRRREDSRVQNASLKRKRGDGCDSDDEPLKKMATFTKETSMVTPEGCQDMEN